MAGKQHLRHRPAAKLLGPRVVRILEAAVELFRERLDQVALLLAERSRQLAADGVDDGHRRDLAAGEDVWADRDLVVGQMVVDTLVEPLVPPAEEREPAGGRE